MKRLLQLITILLLTSCGMTMDIPKHDARFDPIVDQFRKDKKFFENRDFSYLVESISFGNPNNYPGLGGDVISIFHELDQEAEARCFTFENTTSGFLNVFMRVGMGTNFGKRFIIVDPRVLERGADYLEKLVYHELGHCVLDYPHDNDQDIMNEYINIKKGPVFKQNRFFSIREMMTADSEFKVVRVASDALQASINKQLSSSDETEEESTEIENSDEYTKVYSVDYEAFGERIIFNLYKNETKDTYYTSKDSIREIKK